jgi:sugar/nucleoside kinase (ribokinase family)
MTDSGFDLLAVGRPSVDLMFSGLEAWPELGRDVEADGMGVCAGTSFNTPASANRLGLRVGYTALIGNDPWSELIRREFDAEALPTDFLMQVDAPSAFVSVALNLGNDRGFVTWAGGGADDDERLTRFAREVVSTVPARHLHAYAGEEPSDLTRIARSRGMTVSLDAWSGPWWETDLPLDELLDGCDVLFANEAEALAMTGERALDRAVAVLGELCPAVVIKRGPEGAWGRTQGETLHAPAEPADVIDTTGAGDCFNAGFLVGWFAGLRFDEALVLGNVCGAGAVTGFGGYRGCPTREELRTAAAERGIELPESTGRPT